jgi:hypothetical protein
MGVSIGGAFMNRHVCYIADNTFHELALKSIKHAIKHSNTKLHFHILGNIDNKSQGIDYINIPDSFSELHVLDYRAKLPYLMLERGISKFLYLDADTQPVVCLSKLIDIDTEGNVIAGCEQPWCNKFRDAVEWANSRDYNDFEQQLSEEHLDNTFINTGVLLFNCVKYVNEQILDAYLKHKSNCHLQHPVDEWIFNLAVIDRCKIIDKRWNWHPVNVNKQWQRPYIIHDVGKTSRKPGHSTIYT